MQVSTGQRSEEREALQQVSTLHAEARLPEQLLGDFTALLDEIAAQLQAMQPVRTEVQPPKAHSAGADTKAPPAHGAARSDERLVTEGRMTPPPAPEAKSQAAEPEERSDDDEAPLLHPRPAAQQEIATPQLVAPELTAHAATKRLSSEQEEAMTAEHEVTPDAEQQLADQALEQQPSHADQPAIEAALRDEASRDVTVERAEEPVTSVDTRELEDVDSEDSLAAQFEQAIVDLVQRDEQAPLATGRALHDALSPDALVSVLTASLFTQERVTARAEGTMAQLIKQAVDLVQESELNSTVVAGGAMQAGQGANEEPAASRPLPKVLAARTMERVAQVLKEAARSKDGKSLSVRLDPPELGTLKVELIMREGTMHARVVAESPAVNQMLRERAAELHEVLRRAGIEAERINVSVGGEGSTQQFGQQLTERGRSSHGQSRQLGEGGSVTSEVPTPTAQPSSVVLDHWVA